MQGVSNQAFNRDNHEASTHQTNIEEAENGAKQILESEQQRYRWKPVRRESDTMQNTIKT